MVEKPTEGICGACGSENLEFFDDGSGRCTDCDRAFQWALDLAQESTSAGMNNQETIEKTFRSTVRSDGFHPARRPAASLSGERYTSFVNILIIGFLLLIAGYSLMFSMHAATDWAEEPIEFASTMVILSLLLINVGIVIVGLGLVLGAVKAEYLGEELRAWMLMAMAILLGVFLGLGNFLSLVNLL